MELTNYYIKTARNEKLYLFYNGFYDILKKVEYYGYFYLLNTIVNTIFLKLVIIIFKIKIIKFLKENCHIRSSMWLVFIK